MESGDLIYRKLQKHLDRMPVGFPESKSGNDIKILQELFSLEEAQIALELSILPEPAERIYPRVKKFISSIEELENKLKVMLNKGLILGGRILSKDDEVKLYSNAQFCVGLYEFQVDHMTPVMAKKFDNYIITDFFNEFNKSYNIPQLRTIPIEKSVIRENFVETYENARTIIENTNGPIVLANCICKQTGDLTGSQCKTTKLRETCILMRNVALHYIDLGLGRVVEKDEIFRLLDQAEIDGLVIQPHNSKKPQAICCCCGCCCTVFKIVKQYPRPTEHYSSNYYASVNAEKCAGCGTCTSRCQMEAISLKDEKAVVDLDRCIGCGLCTSTCKNGAVALNRKQRQVTPPENPIDMFQKILVNKVGTIAAAKTMIKL